MDFDFWPLICIGIKDGVNPYALANLLILFMLFYFWGSTKKRVWTLTGSFILAVLIVSYLIFAGFSDVFLSKSFFEMMLRKINLGLGIVFVFLGVLYVGDWLRRKRNTRWPVFLREPVNQKFYPLFILILLSFLIGCLSTALSAIWPTDYYLFSLVTLLVMGGQTCKGFGSLAVYMIFYILPLLMLGAGIGRVVSSLKAKNILTKNILIFKMVLASFFLSTGIGLIYLNTRMP